MGAREPIWLEEARKHLGVRETKGPDHTPLILQWWRDAKLGGIKSDETPWCAGFVCAMLENVGLLSPRTAWSRDFLGWGYPLDEPEVGCIIVFARGNGGHVGIVVGRDEKLNPLVLGGNQDDSVSIKAFPALAWEVLGYRWPRVVRVPDPAPLPVLVGITTAESAA